MKRKEYVFQLENHCLTKENLILVKKRMLTRNILMLVIFLVLLLITAVGAPRIKIFIRAFNSKSNVFQIIGISLFLSALVLILLYYISVLCYIFIHKGEDEWVYNVFKIKRKLDLVTFTCKCLSIFLFILIFVLNPCTVDGASMNDTFREDDKVICTDVFYYPKKNDVIVFNAKRYTREDALYIKRVVAIEGDEITFVDGKLYVNGVMEERQNIENSPFATFENIVSHIRQLGGTIINNGAIVPDGMIVVMGDNRLNSKDSRAFGPIYINDIYGKVIMRVYPFDQIRLF